MKFFKLLKKEIMELITFQSLIGIFVGVLMFVLLGSVMGNIGEEMSQKQQDIAICDYDMTAESTASIDGLKNLGYNVKMLEGENDIALSKAANEIDMSAVLVFPKGFGEGINSHKPQEIRLVSQLKSFSMMSSFNNSTQQAAAIIKDNITDSLMKSNTAGIDLTYLKNPIVPVDITVINGKSEMINSSALQGIAMQQSLFIPIIVFILITFATQLNASAIANEKGDKTLETLLSAPVSRLAVLGSKMCASAIFSLLMASVYMIGFSSYMSGMVGGASGGEVALATAPITQAMQNLGLSLNVGQYALLGVQLFLTISIALTISMILGSLAKDLKSAQTLIAPLMFITMIPYFVTMMMDINALPTVAKFALYAIPFTHTFTASSALMFGNNLLFYSGMLYQVIFLIGVMFLAVKVFSGDKIFTMTLEFKKKKKVKIH